MDRPYATLFLLMSVDGKISTGDNDTMDVDTDFPKIPSLKEGLQQYYDLEQQTDYCFFITGRVLAKVGINTKVEEPVQGPTTAVILDNGPHLTEQGITFLSKKHQRVLIATSNESHPVFGLQNACNNLFLIKLSPTADFKQLFAILKNEYSVESLTVQSGGTLNATLVREGLIDRLLLVVAPALIGGEATSTLMDGESLHSQADLFKIKTLELVQAKPLEHSYLLLEYTVR